MPLRPTLLPLRPPLLPLPLPLLLGAAPLRSRTTRLTLLTSPSRLGPLNSMGQRSRSRRLSQYQCGLLWRSSLPL